MHKGWQMFFLQAEVDCVVSYALIVVSPHQQRAQVQWVPAAQVSWFPNHVKGAVTIFLIVPRKDELWQTSFAGRRSLLMGDTIDDEQSSATVNK